jgi:dienelactone hydrolase
MFEYFRGNYPWNLAVCAALNNGAVISEIDEVCRPLIEKAGDGVAASGEWGRAWATLGERLARLGEADAKAGRRRSAGRKFRRAALYNLVAERNMSSHDERRLEFYRKALDQFRTYVDFMGEPVEFVQVPYKGDTLPALFVPAKGVQGPSPCMIHFDGFDVMKEVLYLRGIATELRERGISVLLVDHPGVGEAIRLKGMKLFPETEVPASACVDYLETRKDVDPGKIGIMAISLGGYFAPRAASFEKRLACCVAWGAIWDYGAISESRAQKLEGKALSVSDWVDHIKYVFGTETVEEALTITKRMTLEGVIGNLTCPILVTHGEADKQVPLDYAVKTYEAAVNSSRRELKVFTADEGGVEHCQVDNAPNGTDYMCDWIEDVLK